MSAGVVLRVKAADTARIRELVGQVVGFPCKQVVGRALWDVGVRPELTEITHVPDDMQLDLKGDFGHIFGTTAELRWRRIDDALYDVLILSDSSLDVPDMQALGKDWRTERKTLRENQPGVHYLAPNGAVQFVSYRKEARG